MTIGAATLIGSSSAAMAEDDVRGNGTGGGWVVGKKMNLTSQEKADIDTKVRLWDTYWDYVMEDGSRGDYLQAQQRAEQRLGVRLRAAPKPPCDPRCPSSKILLPVKHTSQHTYFNCGNTTGVMIARYEGRRRSRFNHNRLRQRTMGGRAHMKTYRNRSTPWASKNFKRGINRWLKGRSRGFYQQHKTPRVRRYKKALLYDIAHGHPFAASTIEFRYQAHYNGHPRDELIGHWIVVRGYSKNLRKSKFVDPAAKSRHLSGFGKANKRFTMKSRRMARQFLRPGHGIAA